MPISDFTYILGLNNEIWHVRFDFLHSCYSYAFNKVVSGANQNATVQFFDVTFLVILFTWENDWGLKIK